MAQQNTTTTTTTSSTTIGGVSGQLRHLLHDRYDKVVYYDDDDDDDDDDGGGNGGGDGDASHTRLWSRSHQNYNETIITSTVSIRVTPRDDFMVSWGILAAALGVAIGIAAWQVYKERHIVRQIPIGTSGDGIGIGVVGVGNRGGVGSGSGSGSIRNNRGGGGGGGGGAGNNARDADRLIESASTAEVTRCVVRALHAIRVNIVTRKIAHLILVLHSFVSVVHFISFLFYCLFFWVTFSPVPTFVIICHAITLHLHPRHDLVGPHMVPIRG